MIAKLILNWNQSNPEINYLNILFSSFYHETSNQYWMFQRLVHQGALFQLQRFKVAEQFPAQQTLADVHKAANMFGIRRQNQNRVCPCCSQRIKVSQYSLCGVSMDAEFLASDVVLLFAFIRMLVYYYVLKFIITDIYNIMTSLSGHVCTQKIRCVNSWTHRMTLVNKMDQPHEVFMVDILNLAFVGFSIVFFTCYQVYLYKWFIKMSVQIQTEDDFSLFITNIPVVIDVDHNQEVHYAEVLKNYCQRIVRNWLQRATTDDEIYQDYAKIAIRKRFEPSNPPNIVSKVNLCWDLHQINALTKKKENLMKEYQKWKSKEQKKSMRESKSKKDKEDIIYDDRTTYNQLKTLQKAEIQLAQQFELSEYYGFVISKFLGKAFVSFEYEHFSRVVLDAIPNAQHVHNHYLKGQFALPPRDIYWQNLGITKWERFQKLLITFFACSALICITFLIFFGIKYKQKRDYLSSQKDLSFFGKLFIRVGLSLFTIAINTLLRIAIKKLAKYQQHQTKTEENVFVMYKSIIAIVCNQIINPFAVNYILGNLLWRSNGLTSQIVNLLTISIIINIARSIINPWSIWRWIKFQWTYRNAPPILKYQCNYNQESAYRPFQVYEKYMLYINKLYLISFFSYLVPYGCIMGILFFICKYAIDRVYLLKFSSFHPRYSYDLTQKAVTLASTSVLLYAIGNYLNKWLYFGSWWQPINLISLILAILFTGIIWHEKISKIFTKSHNQYQKLSYTESSTTPNFFHTYNSLNPATKLANLARSHVDYCGVKKPQLPPLNYGLNSSSRRNNRGQNSLKMYGYN